MALVRMPNQTHPIRSGASSKSNPQPGTRPVATATKRGSASTSRLSSNGPPVPRTMRTVPRSTASVAHRRTPRMRRSVPMMFTAMATARIQPSATRPGPATAARPRMMLAMPRRRRG